MLAYENCTWMVEHKDEVSRNRGAWRAKDVVLFFCQVRDQI